MSFFALALVLLSSFIHAGWNLLSKRVGGGAVMIWVISSLTTVLYAPLVIGYVLWAKPVITLAHLGFMLGTGLLHLGYFLVLQRGYQVGAFSVVYPLARGTGPAFSLLGAVLFLGETPTTRALIGAVFLIMGIILISTRAELAPESSEKARLGVFYGIFTGFWIAAYTLLDKVAVSAPFWLAPLLLDYTSHPFRVVFLGKKAWQERPMVRQLWQEHTGRLVGIAVLNPLAFILVLSAMQFTDVHYIAPAREISILIGIVAGAKLFAEGFLRKRLIGAVLMVGGIFLLALG